MGERVAHTVLLVVPTLTKTMFHVTLSNVSVLYANHISCVLIWFCVFVLCFLCFGLVCLCALYCMRRLFTGGTV